MYTHQRALDCEPGLDWLNQEVHLCMLCLQVEEEKLNVRSAPTSPYSDRKLEKKRNTPSAPSKSPILGGLRRVLSPGHKSSTHGPPPNKPAPRPPTLTEKNPPPTINVTNVDATIPAPPKRLAPKPPRHDDKPVPPFPSTEAKVSLPSQIAAPPMRLPPKLPGYDKPLPPPPVTVSISTKSTLEPKQAISGCQQLVVKNWV